LCVLFLETRIHFGFNPLSIQTGLLLGRPGPKPLLLRLAPTPTVRTTQPAAHVGRNCGQLKVSAPLLGEHVRQASGLLPGGVAVLGLFVFGPGGLPVSGSSALLESLAGAWASGWSGGGKERASPPPPCLVYGWCAQTRRVAGRALAWPEKRAAGGLDGAVATAAAAAAAVAAAVASASAPASLRFTPILPTLTLAQATFHLAPCPPVRVDGRSDDRVAASLGRAVAAAGDRAASSIAFIGGELVRPGETVGECVGRLGLEPPQRRLVVELAGPPQCLLVVEEEGEGGPDASFPSPGTVTLSGAVTALALSTPRDSVEGLVAALVADVRRSLALRLAAAVAEAADAEADAAIAAAVPGGFSASNAADEARAQAAEEGGGGEPVPAPGGCCGPAGAGAPGVPSWEVTPPLLRHPAALGGAGGALSTSLGRRGLVVDCGGLPGVSDLALPGTAGEAADDAAALLEGVAQLVLGGGAAAAAALALEWLEAPPADAGPARGAGSGVGAPHGKRMSLSLEGGGGVAAACPLGVMVAGGAAAVALFAAGVAWLST